MADDADRAGVVLERAEARYWQARRAARAHVARRSDDCRDCGEPIEPRRLTAEPTAIRCTACQTQHEGRRHG